LRCSIGSEKGTGGVEGERKPTAAWSEANLDQAALDFFLKQGRCLSNGACAGRCTRPATGSAYTSRSGKAEVGGGAGQR